MDKLNEILRASKDQAAQAAKTVSDKAAASGATQQAQAFLTRKEFTKFLTQNKLPWYLLYGIIFVKFTTIYDKLRQIVAINAVYD